MRPDLMSMDPSVTPLSPLQDVVQHHPIDLPIHPHPHVVVLPVHEVGERLEEPRGGRPLRGIEPLLRLVHRLAQQDRLELSHHVGRERQEVLGAALEEVQPVQRVQPLQLADGVGVVVDADVDVAIVAAQVARVGADHEQRRRLHPPLVPAAGLAGGEGGHQPVGERARGPQVRVRHVLHRLVGHHDVRLRGEAAAHDHLPLSRRDDVAPRRERAPAGPVEARVPRPARGVAVRVHHADLPLRATRVAAHHDAQRLRRARPPRHQLQPLRAVRRVAERLRRHRPYTRPRPGDDAPHVGELGLHRDTQISGRGIVGDDRVGVGALQEVGRDGGGLLRQERDHEQMHPYSFRIFFFSSCSWRSAAASRALRSSSALSSSSWTSTPGRAPPAACRSRHARSALRSAAVSGRSRSAAWSCACMSPSSRSASACSSRCAWSLRSSTATRSRCLPAKRSATCTVSWSCISPANRPRRSASARRWRSAAGSPSVRCSASANSRTATFASTTASRIWRARSFKSCGGVAASSAALSAARRRSNIGRSALPGRLREERREQRLHVARPALGAFGEPAPVLGDRLGLRETRVALGAAVFVDGHTETKSIPRGNEGQVDSSRGAADIDSMRLCVAALAALVVACNGGLGPAPAPTSCPKNFTGICGTLTIRGATPESTDVVYVVAYQTFPQSRGDLFSYTPLVPPTISLADTTYFYTLPVPNGRYEWVLAVWKKQGILTIANADSLLREAGYYKRSDPDTAAFGAGIVVVNSIGTDSINFVVDFTNMHPVSFYFPAAAAVRE